MGRQLVNLEKASQDACASVLRQYGFVVKRRGVLLQPGGNAAVTGWLGLNVGTWSLPDVLHVNPVVGVRHVPLEKLLVELAGRKAPVPCVSLPLGNIMPQNYHQQWDFPAVGDLETVAQDLAKTVAEYGQPFIDRWSDWSTYSDEIEDSGLLLEDEKHIVLPLVAEINGDRHGAELLIQRELNRIGEAPDVYSSSYRAFATKFAAKAADFDPR
jgi:hypothetical protein